MTMNLRWYLGGLLALFAGYVALEYYRPKPVDWTPTLINKDQIPYGTYVLYDQLPRLLGTDSLTTSRLPIYNQITGMSLETSDALAEARTTTIEIPRQEPDSTASAESDSPADSSATAETADATAMTDSSADDSGAAGTTTTKVTKNGITTTTTTYHDSSTDADSTTTADGDDESEDEEADDDESAYPRANYLFVSTNFTATQADLGPLLGFVAQGNDVFIAAESFGDAGRTLLDSLGLRLRRLPLAAYSGPRKLLVPDSVAVHFTNPALAGPRYHLPAADADLRLEADTAHPHPTFGPAQALATDEQGRAVLVRSSYGAGHVYLCTVPVAFTNLLMLRPATSRWVATALSYLPVRPTWWDEYQKQGRVGNQSLLRLVTSHEALNTAWYLLLAGGLLFVLVEARRRQRIIPTLKPLPNSTLLFTRTVAGLYRQGRSHGPIAEKKVGLFLDYLRTRFQEPTPDFADDNFRERLSQKSGVARPQVDELLRLVNFTRTAPQVSDEQLLKLSRALSDFRREARR
ncbi:MAG: hypothetical protein M3Y54_09070 [Bacteroidota bacterium]|nr:hypothetical protein [Bacteroidota bacterium]